MTIRYMEVSKDNILEALKMIADQSICGYVSELSMVADTCYKAMDIIKELREMKVSNCTVATSLTGVVKRGSVNPVFEMKNGLYYLSIVGFCAANYPVGTRVIITLEEPEPPKERIVLPEGMVWKENILWSPEGLLVAGYFWKTEVCFFEGWCCLPNSRDTAKMEYTKTHEEAKHTIEEFLALHNYFGVKKVVDNE